MKKLGALICLLFPVFASAQTWTLDRCIKYALSHSATVEEGKAEIDVHKATLAQVESVFYPKLSALGFIAPMFTVEGSALQPTVKRDYSFGAWGPYTNLDVTLVQPLYTFGRVKAGKDAALGRVEIEEAQLRVTQSTVALEVAKMYYTHLYALSMLPSLNSARKMVSEGLEKAREMYDKGTGAVTLPDVMKMSYGNGEIMRYIKLAENGAQLSLAALKHTMGLPANEELVLEDGRLPRADDVLVPDLATEIQLSASQRPEWDQLGSGDRAALSLEQAEKLANLPVLALAGMFNYAWAPTRDDSDNPYHNDPYNDISGGAALALKWEFDGAAASAKAKGARALGAKAKAIRRFAESGIPLQVKKAHMDLAQNLELLKISDEAVVFTRKWMTFAGAAYMANTGEAKDMLEGLVAHLQSKQSYYENLRDVHVASVELDFATGKLAPAKKSNNETERK